MAMVFAALWWWDEGTKKARPLVAWLDAWDWVLL
jgi:hypothetical protein